MHNPLSSLGVSLSARREVFRMHLRDWATTFRALAERQEGQTMAEYGVVLAVITLGVVAALGFLALAVTGKLNDVTTSLGGAIK
jgi:Flp pilus assembly pilin Flp